MALLVSFRSSDSRHGRHQDRVSAVRNFSRTLWWSKLGISGLQKQSATDNNAYVFISRGVSHSGPPTRKRISQPQQAMRLLPHSCPWIHFVWPNPTQPIGWPNPWTTLFCPPDMPDFDQLLGRRLTINCLREYWTTRITHCTSSYFHRNLQHHRTITSDAAPMHDRKLHQLQGHLSDCNFITMLHTHTHTRLTAFFPGLPRWSGTRKIKTSLNFTEALASAGPYASLHLAPIR